MSRTYSRQDPSSRYVELIDLYQQMHEQGESSRCRTAEQTYRGISLLPHAPRIKELLRQHEAKTLLDYGCGKGLAYRGPVQVKGEGRYGSVGEFWGIRQARLYDPAVKAFSRLPSGTFDAVVCTDVLEHCPEQDVPWILEELFGFAGKLLYANVACYPALAHLPTGENAHCTIRPMTWWVAQIERAGSTRPEVAYEFVFTCSERRGDGAKYIYNQTLMRSRPTLR